MKTNWVGAYLAYHNSDFCFFLGHPTVKRTQRRIRETNSIISRTEHIDSKMSLSTILLSSEAGDLVRANDLVKEV